MNKRNAMTSQNLTCERQSERDVAGSGRGLTSLYASALRVQVLWVATSCSVVNTGALFYLTTVARHFPSAHLTYRTLKCKERQIERSLRGTFPAASISMASTNVMLAAVTTELEFWFESVMNLE